VSSLVRTGSPFVSAGSPPVSAGGTRIETISGLAGFQALREEWTELLESSSNDCIFLTWEWLHTWWKHLGAGRQLDLIAIRRDGELIGLAPFVVCPRRLSRLVPCRTRQFLGTGSVGSDYLDVIVRQGQEPEALSALAAHLAEAGMALDLAQVNRRSAAALDVARRLEQRAWRVSERAGDVCPFIDLRGQTWLSYLASLDGQHRYNFKRRAGKLTKDFAMRFELAASEGERREALAALVALHMQRWSARGGSTALYASSLVAFHEEFSQLALARGWLRLFVLRLDSRPVAALYGFRYRDTFCFYQTGFDPGFSRHGVGQVTVGLTIKHAIEEGATTYDLLHGDERYKFDWARQVRELGRLELYPPSARGWLCRRTKELERAARKSARRLLPRTVADWVARRANNAID
jgi:CelD/BcsL family acetyltransferase involved in cellulose biosynthesis